MTDPQRDTFKAFVLDTLRGRVVSALVIAALLMGLAGEGISILTAYYRMKTERITACSKTMEWLTGTPAVLADGIPEEQIKKLKSECRY
jgi:hypothetical protein